MKIYINNVPNIDYIECTSEEGQDLLGAWVDLATLPDVLGSTLGERIENYTALRKQGIILVESYKL